MSELSDDQRTALTNGPESPYVVDAIDSLLRGDVTAARLALIEGAEISSWAAIGHRLDVVGRALTADAGITLATVPDEVDLVPDVLATTVDHVDAEVPSLLARWCIVDPPVALPITDIWPSLAVVAWMVSRAGYPAEVVV